MAAWTMWMDEMLCDVQNDLYNSDSIHEDIGLFIPDFLLIDENYQKTLSASMEEDHGKPDEKPQIPAPTLGHSQDLDRYSEKSVVIKDISNKEPSVLLPNKESTLENRSLDQPSLVNEVTTTVSSPVTCSPVSLDSHGEYQTGNRPFISKTGTKGDSDYESGFSPYSQISTSTSIQAERKKDVTRKGRQLPLCFSEEECRMLVKEGYSVPTSPITKEKAQQWKKIKRKLKNKMSAKESRKRKKEQLDTLDRQVKRYKDENEELRSKIMIAERQNQTIQEQLKMFQEYVMKMPNEKLKHQSVQTD